MSNIIIIGNGFDLAHGLKSNYPSFIKELTNSLLSDGNDIFKSKFTDITNYEQLVESLNSNTRALRLQQKDRFLGLLLKDMALKNWCDIEEVYFQQLLQIAFSGTDFDGVIDLHQQFNKLKIKLQDYLLNESESKKSNKIDQYENFFYNIEPRETLILNFNYTNTVTKYKGVFNRIPVAHIHGELFSELNPIIFGYAADNIQSRKLIDKKNREYMRNIKKHCYKRTNIEVTLQKFLNKSRITVYLLGHSCGLSDKLILNQIFNHKNVAKISLFYFEEHENYFDQQVNIDRIMNNDDNFKKLQNFQDSIRMPQLNDTEDQKREFNNNVKKL